MKLVKLDGFGKPWEGTFKGLMEYYAKSIDMRFQEQDILRILDRSSCMLSYGDIGNRLYDIMAVYASRDGHDVTRLIEVVQKFVASVSVYDFVRVARAIAFEDRLNGNVAEMTFKIICSLIVTGYDFGRLVGVDSKEKKVIFSEEWGPCEAEAYSIMLLQKSGEVNIPHGKVAEKKSVRYLKYLSSRDTAKISVLMKSLKKDTLISWANKCHNFMKMSYFLSFYNEIEKDYHVVNDFLVGLVPGSEDVYPKDVGTMQSYRDLFMMGLVDKDILKKRDVYVREKGIRMILNFSLESIGSLCLREFHSEEPFEEHLLLLTYITRQGFSRIVPLDMTSIKKFMTPVLFDQDVIAAMFIYSWLGIARNISLDPDKIAEVFPEDTDQYSNLFSGMLEVLSKPITSDALTYEVPYQWNYGTQTQSTGKGSRDSVYPNTTRKIGRYSRKLPTGQKASEEAKALAKRVFFELEEGKTFVDEFERTQKVRLDSSDAF